MKAVSFCTLLVLFATSPLFAETVDISDSLRVHFELPSGWVSNLEPPQFLVDKMAEHIKHDAAKKQRYPSKEQLQQAALKRFKSNEALLYNPDSEAFMSLDFSSLGQGDKAPSHKSIKLSTRYAGESLSNEGGVTELTTDNTNIDIQGSWYAHRFDASYKQHGRPMAFTGVVGFVSPYWFYFYYTDYLKNEQDRVSVEKILKSVRVENR